MAVRRRLVRNSMTRFSAAPETRYPLPKGIPQTHVVVESEHLTAEK